MIFKDNNGGGGKKIQPSVQTLDTKTTTIIIPKGRHTGKGVVHIVPETKTVSPSTVVQNITPASGKVLSEVIVKAIEGDATREDVLTGKTFSSKYGIDITGLMANNESNEVLLDADHTSFTIKKGYHDGTGKVLIEPISANLTPSASEIVLSGQGNLYDEVKISAVPGTAVASNVLKGKTFSSKSAGTDVSGTMPNLGNTTKTATTGAYTTDSSGKSVFDITIPSNGYYNTGSKLRFSDGAKLHPGNAVTANVLAGKTFSSNNLLNATGSMANFSGWDIGYSKVEAYEDNEWGCKVWFDKVGYIDKTTYSIIYLESLWNSNKRFDPRLYKVGFNISTDNHNIDIKSLFPDNYSDFTKSNFLIVPKDIKLTPYCSGSGNGGLSNSGFNIITSYNASTGVLSIRGNTCKCLSSATYDIVWKYGEGFGNHTFYGGATAVLTYDVYLSFTRDRIVM